MTIRQFLPYTTAFAMAFLPGLVRADVLLDSGAGLATCMFNSDASSCGSPGSSIAFGGQGVTTTSVTFPDPSWQGIPVVNPGDSSDQSAVWIGAVDSGYDPTNTGLGTFVASNLSAPVYQITSQTFIAAAGQQLDLDVWADDSVDVYLVNNTAGGSSVEISPAATATQNPPCSGQTVSCTPPTEGKFVDSLTAGDTYSLQFNVWQTGPGGNNYTNPTGLLYTGAVVNTPEPGAATLLVIMLMAVAGFAGILKKKLA